jgi:mycothione reductase
VESFDLIVIGSGSGLEVSSSAAARGLSVAVVEHGPFGGTCLNRGCIPSKMLIHSADVMETIQRARLFGIKAQVSAVDWDFIVKRAVTTVDSDAQAVEEGNRQHPNITVFKGTGRFVGPKTLEVGGERISAETIVIAAGSRPRIPSIEGLTDVPFITSDEALRLPKQPRRLIIVGGGTSRPSWPTSLAPWGPRSSLFTAGRDCYALRTTTSQLVSQRCVSDGSRCC